MYEPPPDIPALRGALSLAASLLGQRAHHESVIAMNRGQRTLAQQLREVVTILRTEERRLAALEQEAASTAALSDRARENPPEKISRGEFEPFWREQDPHDRLIGQLPWPPECASCTFLGSETLIGWKPDGGDAPFDFYFHRPTGRDEEAEIVGVCGPRQDDVWTRGLLALEEPPVEGRGLLEAIMLHHYRFMEGGRT